MAKKNEQLSVADRAREIIASQLHVDDDQVTPGTKLEEDLGADSLDGVELIMELEEQFGITIKDEDAERIAKGTVQDVYDYLRDHVTEQ